MEDLTIELSIVSMSEGLLYLYDESGRDIDIECELEFEYDPPEKECIDCPAVDERLELVRVKAPFGEIDIDTIQNMDGFNIDALECMHREGLESSECPELFNGTMIDLNKLSLIEDK